MGIGYYFIDKIGMLGMESWGAVDQRLREAHATPKPLGGRSLIVFGHHAQLPPVNDDLVHFSLAATTTMGKKRKPKKQTSLETNGLYVHGLFQDAAILAVRVEYDLYQGFFAAL